MSEIMYPYPKKMYPTKEDILYNIEEGIISKEVGEELIKQIELQKRSETLFPRGQVKQPYTKYEFELRSVSDDFLDREDET